MSKSHCTKPDVSSLCNLNLFSSSACSHFSLAFILLILIKVFHTKLLNFLSKIYNTRPIINWIKYSFLDWNVPWRKNLTVLVTSFQSRNFFYFNSLLYINHYEKQKTKMSRNPETLVLWCNTIYSIRYTLALENNRWKVTTFFKEASI